jgi:hypothetical protein
VALVAAGLLSLSIGKVTSAERYQIRTR